MLGEVGEDPDHPLRAKAEEGLAELAADLQHDPAMQARVEAMKREVIDNPAMQRWLDGLWESARASLIRYARDPAAGRRGVRPHAPPEVVAGARARPALRA